MKKKLYNNKSKDQLLNELADESFQRITCSFYKYVGLDNLEELRKSIYIRWSELKVLGRVYIAEEGINAQINVPEHNLKLFINRLQLNEKFQNITIKYALEEGLSFYKLTVKIKKELVAYKLPNNEFDLNKRGRHIDYNKFHQKIDDGAVVVDVRNYYENEIGHFKNAIISAVDRSEELLPDLLKLLEGHQENTVLMYCTGGIRCEKASAYLIRHGFRDVHQLTGGIIKYANDIKEANVKSRFVGKNFVFDHRLGETITDDIISKCHQCNNPSNSHLDCENQACHILFIQCEDCALKYNNCCSFKCADFIKLPEEKQKQMVRQQKVQFTAQISNRTKPKLYEI